MGHSVVTKVEPLTSPTVIRIAKKIQIGNVSRFQLHFRLPSKRRLTVINRPKKEIEDMNLRTLTSDSPS